MQGFFPGGGEFLEFFQPAAVWKSDENNLAAASTDFFDSGGRIAKATTDRLPNFCHELLFGNISWWRWRCEKRDPNLLDLPCEFAPGTRTFLPHAGAPLAIDRLEIGRKARWHERARAISNWQSLQPFAQCHVLLLQESDAFFERERKIFAGALGRRLRMKSFHCLFAVFHWRRTGGRNK